MVNVGIGPCWVEVKRINEYVAEINETKAIKRLSMEDFDRIDVRRRISLIRFIDGGPPKLAVTITNHHKVMDGNTVRSPLVRKRLRVCVVS